MVCIWGKRLCLSLLRVPSAYETIFSTLWYSQNHPTHPFSSSFPFENAHFFPGQAQMKIVFVSVFFPLSPSRYPQRVSEQSKKKIPYSSKLASFPPFFVFDFSSGLVFWIVSFKKKVVGFVFCFFFTWDLLRPFGSKPRFSLTVCLILKLGDSYLWQLRDSTHGDPPTVEGYEGKISDISMPCSTDKDTVWPSLCFF